MPLYLSGSVPLARFDHESIGQEYESPLEIPGPKLRPLRTMMLVPEVDPNVLPLTTRLGPVSVRGFGEATDVSNGIGFQVLAVGLKIPPLMFVTFNVEPGHFDTQEEKRSGCLVNTFTRVGEFRYRLSVEALAPRKTSFGARAGKADTVVQSQLCIFHVCETLS